MACLDPVAMDCLLADLSDNDDLEMTPGDGSPINIQGPEDGLPINIEGLGRDNMHQFISDIVRDRSTTKFHISTCV
jgi:hypothetical protein